MIKLEIPGLPPSVNHAYMTIMKVRGSSKIPLRVLTKEGRSYKKTALGHLATTYPAQLAQVKNNVPYGLLIQLITTKIENKGWPDKAESRYKTFDASNRIKIVEDVLTEATAVNDACNLWVAVAKVQGTDERTVLTLYNLEEEESPLDAVF